jgi:hypothetical protein
MKFKSGGKNIKDVENMTRFRIIKQIKILNLLVTFKDKYGGQPNRQT